MQVAECLSDTPAIGLHVYGGDILDLRPNVEYGYPEEDMRLTGH